MTYKPRSKGGVRKALSVLKATQPDRSRRRADPVQAKLMVGASNDPAEHEADQVADTVIARLSERTEGETTEQAPAPTTTRIRRSAASKGAGVVGAEGGALDGDSQAKIDAARRGGSPLPDKLQRDMEAGFGRDFSSVRVHTGPAADAAASQIQASAFTTGNDVVFAKGQFRPDAPEGQHLVAHELAHVAQQGGGVARTVRRMPTSRAVKERSGKESKKGVNLFGKNLGGTKSYNAVLSALDKYQGYLRDTVIAPSMGGAAKQLVVLNKHLDGVLEACNQYVNKEDADPNVLDIVQGIIAKIPVERMVLGQIAARYGKMPPMGGNPKWILVVPEDPNTYVASNMTSTDSGGEGGKGANKEVAKVTKGGTSGFFSEDSQSGRYDEMKYDENVKSDMPMYDAPRGLLGDMGVKDENLRLAARSVAMSRLDKLLNAGVIAHTEMTLKSGKIGTFMQGASGIQGEKAIKEHPELGNDPTLPRLLSRLHLIDLIAGQVDRHMNNYFIEFDKGGKVVKVTGIDLDMSFVPSKGGKNKVDVKGGSQDKTGHLVEQLPGLSQYVDEDLAERIIDLDPEDLRAILADLLDEASIQGALDRLQQLQEMLRDMQSKGKLLKRNQWDQVVRQGLRSEEESKKAGKSIKAGAGSYYGRDIK